MFGFKAIPITLVAIAGLCACTLMVFRIGSLWTKHVEENYITSTKVPTDVIQEEDGWRLSLQPDPTDQLYENLYVVYIGKNTVHWPSIQFGHNFATSKQADITTGTSVFPGIRDICKVGQQLNVTVRWWDEFNITHKAKFVMK